MRIGSAIALIVVGAILAFGVKASIPGVDLEIVGYILMVGGAIGGLIFGIMGAKSNKSETVRAVDPASGSETVRTETNATGPEL